MARVRTHSEPGPSSGEVRFHDCSIPAHKCSDTRKAISSVMPGIKTCLRHRAGMHVAAPGYAATVACEMTIRKEASGRAHKSGRADKK